MRLVNPELFEAARYHEDAPLAAPFQERQQVGVNRGGVRRGHAMRKVRSTRAAGKVMVLFYGFLSLGFFSLGC
jgi:hypothetical protein